jgi:hypothetical protein
MSQKTASLSYPSDPLNAMRELQELNHKVPEAVPKKDKPVQGNVTSSEVANVTSSVAANVTDESPIPKPKVPRKERSPRPEIEDADPLSDALIQLIAKPYDSDDAKGPFTSTTVKIQTELWERLGYASTLTSKPKQELLAESLRDYFRKLVKGQKGVDAGTDSK